MGVRQLHPGDEAVVRALRLRALGESPEHFTSTFDREAARTPEDWRQWFSPGATFVFDDGPSGPVGLVAAVCDSTAPQVVELMALWVEPDARGAGVGGALVDAVVGWAGGHGAPTIRLRVLAANAPALRLYERRGFRRVARHDHPAGSQVEMEHR